MMPFVRTFESNLYALLAVFLFGRQGWLLFQTGKHLSAAGCAHYDKLYCNLIFSYAPSGLSALLTLIVAGAGLFGAWEMLAGRRRGMVILFTLYALQIPLWATSSVHHLPSPFNFYFLWQHRNYALGLNFAALILSLSALGLLQNSQRRKK